MELAKQLEEQFGHGTFRPGQREVIEILLAGRSALAVFPTGGGKSLCYQFPALQLEGLTLVVSPLIALMRDQVTALKAAGHAAERIDSSLEAAEVQAIYAAMDSGALKLLYVAPERLANEGFLARLRQTRIGMLAIDEAHCISEWGHNFRPDYLKLGRLVEDLAIPQVLALTATATTQVSEDIRRHFGIAEADHVQTGFHRANLHFHVTPCPAAKRDALLIERLTRRPEESGEANGPVIVYVTLQQTAEVVAGTLTAAGLQAKAYHAGLPDDYRAEVQDAFMAGDLPIVVATIAFGMGIDKADIRAVYHYNLPKSLENYVQESGRAGRDGAAARCEILACAEDRIVLENFVYGDTPSPRAVRQLVEHLLLQGERFSISRYDLSGTNDIRPLVVATALTHLELRDVLLPGGPFYATYRIRLSCSVEQLLAGYDAKEKRFLQDLLATAKKGRTWLTLDVAAAAAQLGEPEERIRSALRHLEESGDVALQPSGLRHAYRLTPDEDRRSVARLSEELNDLFAHRERGEIARIGRVLGYCESRTCLTRQLVEYFGDTLEAGCGLCSNCLAPDQSGASEPLPGLLPESLTTEQVETIRAVWEEKHPALRQPRQVARFLCGISSPATTRARLSRHDRFGALGHVPFQIVLTQVESMG